jgi:hypothetical protein
VLRMVTQPADRSRGSDSLDRGAPAAILSVGEPGRARPAGPPFESPFARRARTAALCCGGDGVYVSQGGARDGGDSELPWQSEGTDIGTGPRSSRGLDDGGARHGILNRSTRSGDALLRRAARPQGETDRSGTAPLPHHSQGICSTREAGPAANLRSQHDGDRTRERGSTAAAASWVRRPRRSPHPLSARARLPATAHQCSTANCRVPSPGGPDLAT